MPSAKHPQPHCPGGVYGWAGRTLASEDMAKPLAGSSQDVLRSLEPRVTDFTLPNGLRVRAVVGAAAGMKKVCTHAAHRCWCWNAAMHPWCRV